MLQKVCMSFFSNCPCSQPISQLRQTFFCIHWRRRPMTSPIHVLLDRPLVSPSNLPSRTRKALKQLEPLNKCPAYNNFCCTYFTWLCSSFSSILRSSCSFDTPSSSFQVPTHFQNTSKTNNLHNLANGNTCQFIILSRPKLTFNDEKIILASMNEKLTVTNI